jgi:hypothetical protein
MGTKKISLPSEHDITIILREHEPIGQDKVVAIVLDINDRFQLPGKIFNTTVLRDIIRHTRDTHEIAERIVALFPGAAKAPRAKELRGERSDAYLWGRTRRKKSSGRKKDKVYALFRDVDAIFSADNIRDWQNKFSMNVLDCFRLRMQMVCADQGEDVFFPLRDYPDEAQEKMGNELRLLCETLILFYNECSKARRDNDVTFLNIVRAVFKEDPDLFAPRQHGKGDKVKPTTLKKGLKLFRKYATAKSPVTIPKTFYTRERVIGLCHLARLAYYTMEYADKLVRERKEAVQRITTAINEYQIAARDIFPGALIDDTSQIEELPKGAVKGRRLGGGFSQQS